MASKKVPFLKLKPRGLKIETWKTIMNGWQNGLSDREVAFLASKDGTAYVTEEDVKEWLTDPEIATMKDFLQCDLLSQAKLNIAENVKSGNVSTSKWLLERKAPDEFSTKAAVAFEGAVVGLTMEEKQAEIDKLLEGFGVGSKEGESDGSDEV